ncbi:probetacellulin isoform X1 [Motacilla alba alba]|nr:probetacellulin isoform X1 [Motacilla alba alba]
MAASKQPQPGWRAETLPGRESSPALGFQGSFSLRREQLGFGPLAGLVTALGKTCQTCAGRRKPRGADLFWGWCVPSEHARVLGACSPAAFALPGQRGGVNSKTIQCLGYFPGLSLAAQERLQPGTARPVHQGGLAFFSCVGADTNVTAGHGPEGLSCGTAKGCTGNGTQLRRQSHFSRCPEEYQHYCVKGRCRFLVAEQAPACVCERGYTGARCERVDLFYLRGDQGQIVIISLIVAIAALIILVVGICLCSHHCRRQRRKRKAEEMETLNKDGPSRSEDVRETGIA